MSKVYSTPVAEGDGGRLDIELAHRDGDVAGGARGAHIDRGGSDRRGWYAELIAGCGEPPGAADAIAERGTGTGIGVVGIERHAVIGELLRAVLAVEQGQLAGHAGRERKRLGSGEGNPGDGAIAGAGALVGDGVAVGDVEGEARRAWRSSGPGCRFRARRWLPGCLRPLRACRRSGVPSVDDGVASCAMAATGSATKTSVSSSAASRFMAAFPRYRRWRRRRGVIVTPGHIVSMQLSPAVRALSISSQRHRAHHARATRV